MGISKSQGQTPTEKLLSELCDKTFLKLWCYANPFKSDGKELCDLLAVFDNHVFIFFDRESQKFKDNEKDIFLQWSRWEKEVVQKQIKTAGGACEYIKRYSDKIFLDQNSTIPFPLTIPSNDIQIHTIIVAHGAKDACKDFSSDNIYGSLATSYGKKSRTQLNIPFFIQLDKKNLIHVFDSHNLEIILNELDTFHDFSAYLIAKERIINQLDNLVYCGEEDLLANYFANYDEINNKYFIGIDNAHVKGITSISIGEGDWKNFIESTPYKNRKEANKTSYLWDDLIQGTCEHAFNNSLLGNANIFSPQNAIYEMAKEPRFTRRVLSEKMRSSVKNFTKGSSGMARHISLMPSFYSDKSYIFLQLYLEDIAKYDYDNEYRRARQKILEIACGSAKNKFPHLNKIIGIAIDAPKFSENNSEDFIFFDCEHWSDEEKVYYEEENHSWQFFQSETLKMEMRTDYEFPE